MENINKQKIKFKNAKENSYKMLMDSIIHK